MFKNLNNKPLFFLLIIYTLSHILLYTNNLFINYINPLFCFLIIINNPKIIPNKKEINITLTISIIFFILYITSGFIFGFSNYNITLNNICKNLWLVFLPIYCIEIIRYKLIKSNKNNRIRALITIIIIISERIWC